MVQLVEAGVTQLAMATAELAAEQHPLLVWRLQVLLLSELAWPSG